MGAGDERLMTSKPTDDVGICLGKIKGFCDPLSKAGLAPGIFDIGFRSHKRFAGQT